MRRERLAGGGGAFEQVRSRLQVAELVEHPRQPLDDQRCAASRAIRDHRDRGLPRSGPARSWRCLRTRDEEGRASAPARRRCRRGSLPCRPRPCACPARERRRTRSTRSPSTSSAPTRAPGHSPPKPPLPCRWRCRHPRPARRRRSPGRRCDVTGSRSTWRRPGGRRRPSARWRRGTAARCRARRAAGRADRDPSGRSLQPVLGERARMPPPRGSERDRPRALSRFAAAGRGHRRESPRASRWRGRLRRPAGR